MTSPVRALVVIDVQNEYFDGPLEIQYPPHAESLPNIAAAIDAATAAGLPIVVVQHTAGDEAPVFNPGRPGFALHPEVESRRTDSWFSITKQYNSVFAGTELLGWLRERDIDTVTFVGYMTNNCVISSAAAAADQGLGAEVLSDATGAINIANDAGYADAEAVHTTLMTLLHSNLASVSSTAKWTEALQAGTPLPGSDLVTSALTGTQRAIRT
ncbi:isochorismatase family protein [Nitriliruptor alkaliphilus]|uniref:isochorismatase family protein n=1 Tax=Nitriliruptor alkaliphilus TaxID=427918 RepID=UPI000696DDAE|nr:isochorismatase family protein [Nitriliruptor alkaliphilus]